MARARVALGRIHHSFLHIMRVFFVMEAPLRRSERRARKRRPYAFRWADCVCGTVGVVWRVRAWDGWFRLVGLRVNGWLVCVGCVEK